MALLQSQLWTIVQSSPPIPHRIGCRPRPPDPAVTTRGRLKKQALLDAAVDLIAERGLEGLSHRLVAARANVSSSTPGYFFTSIDALVGAAVA